MLHQDSTKSRVPLHVGTVNFNLELSFGEDVSWNSFVFVCYGVLLGWLEGVILIECLVQFLCFCVLWCLVGLARGCHSDGLSRAIPSFLCFWSFVGLA